MNSQKQLVEGALFAAIFIVMLIIGAYIPPVGLFLVYILPLPLTVYAYRNTFRYALITMVVSMILVFLVAPPITIINAIIASIAGTVYGTMIRKNKSPILCFLGLVFTFTMEFVLVESLASTAMGYSVIDPLIENFKNLVTYLVDFIELAKKWISTNTPQLNVGIVRYILEIKINEGYLLSFLSMSASGIFVVAGVFNSLLCISITSIVFYKLKYRVIPLPNLESVRAKRILVIIFCLICFILLSKTDIIYQYSFVTTILVNVYILLIIYFIIVGYIEFCSYINRLQIGRILKVVICLSSIFVFGIFLLYFGIFKSLFNGEKKLEKK